MSDSDCESESDLDFSPSEDEYIPTADDDESEDDDDDEEEDVVASTSYGKSPNKFEVKQQTRKVQRIGADDSDGDSDSSVENYLVNPNEIDLASDFFDPNKVVESNVAPQFDCNVGLNLSDSDEEIFEAVPSTSQAAAAKIFDFNAHNNFHKDLKSAKEHLQNFKSTNFDPDSSNVDVTKLLAIGEPSLVAKKSSQSKRQDSDSDESDFEEVEEDVKPDNKSNVEIHIGPVVKQKVNKQQAEIEASIKRKINRRTKDNQLMMHKVHLLSWIGYGNFINRVLNSTKLMEMVLKYIPSGSCYPKEQTDKNYFEQITKWYKTTVGLKTKEQNCDLKHLPPIATSLALQIQSKMAICKKDFVFIFVILLRSMGIQCRLVINLAIMPMRPAAKDLCVISTKTAAEKPKSSSSKAKTEEKTAAKESGSGKKKVTSKAKSTTGTKSVSEKRTKILSQKSEGTNQSTDGPSGDKRNNLKRSVSVQSVANVDKRRRKENPTKAEGSSSTSGSKQLNDPKSNQSATTTTSKSANVIASPISHRTRKFLAKSSSQTIPQLDGGDDKKTKSRKGDQFKIRLPLRTRSVSPSKRPITTRRRSKSVAIADSPPHGRAKPSLLKTKPSTSKTQPKPHNSTSEHESKNQAAAVKPTKPTEPKKTAKKHTDAPTELSKSKLPIVENGNPSAVRSADVKSEAKTKSSSRTVTSSLRSKKPTTNVERPTKPAVKRSKPTDVMSSSDSDFAPSPRKILSPNEKAISNGVPLTSSKLDPKTKPAARAVASSLNSTESSKLTKPTTNQKTPTKPAMKRNKPTEIMSSSDSDFVPTPRKNASPAAVKPLPKQVEMLKKRIDRRVLSTDDESADVSAKKNEMNYWIEVYCEAESKWICIDLFKLTVNCVDDLKKKATKPIVYVFAWNNSNKIKDVSPRYCSQWNTTTRMLRVQSEWLDEALSRYKEPLSQRCIAEDKEFEKIHSQAPIPTSISEFKNHPLYVLKRHLLKFEGIYPPNPPIIATIRDEPIYSRLCVHTLHSREIWVKQARVVKPGEEPYKIVKARPKWDRVANKMLEAQPLEIFGIWQTGPYEPPTAENGIVPRNAYGNVELFKPEMLPKKTVHLRLGGLNRVCAKLKIDCAQAVVGFDFHGGSSHPTFDGFVVCEEFAELVTAKWLEEQEEAYQK